MNPHYWIDEFPTEITVMDQHGILLEMNQKAEQIFEDQGGRGLLGTNILDCHPEPDRSRLIQLMESQQTNVYTVRKGRIRELVYQSPWFKDGQYRGFVEISFEIPLELTEKNRD